MTDYSFVIWSDQFHPWSSLFAMTSCLVQDWERRFASPTVRPAPMGTLFLSPDEVCVPRSPQEPEMSAGIQRSSRHQPVCTLGSDMPFQSVSFYSIRGSDPDLFSLFDPESIFWQQPSIATQPHRSAASLTHPGMEAARTRRLFGLRCQSRTKAGGADCFRQPRVYGLSPFMR